MAYTDDVPAVWNAWPLFKSASTSSMDTRLLLVGDSKINPDATSAPLGHGICRTWPVAAWSFISPRSGYRATGVDVQRLSGCDSWRCDYHP